MIQLEPTSRRFSGALAGVVLVLAVSGCTAVSPSATSSNWASESSGSSATPQTSSSASSTPDQHTAPGWTATGSMIEARYNGHTATLLEDGKVLVAGGVGGQGVPVPGDLVSELYDPSSGIWAVTGRMIGARFFHTATLLEDGKVLVAGGYGANGCCLASAELYDPGSGSWTTTGKMHEARSGHTATLLPDGKVLVAGGDFPSSTSAELYDPSNGSWTATGGMIEGRTGHTATLLPHSKVLVVGGHGGGANALASAELYDPDSGSWTATRNLHDARANHWAWLLSDGKVLVLGGGAGGGANPVVAAASAELYDPSSGIWTVTANTHEPRSGCAATLLRNDNVLVACGYSGGTENPPVAQPSGELYDPSSGIWAATANMHEPRSGHTATLLSDGRVLVAGGSTQAATELYDPGSGT